MRMHVWALTLLVLAGLGLPGPGTDQAGEWKFTEGEKFLHRRRQ